MADTIQFMFNNGVELVFDYDWEKFSEFWMTELRKNSESVQLGTVIIKVDKILWVKKV